MATQVIAKEGELLVASCELFGKDGNPDQQPPTRNRQPATPAAKRARAKKLRKPLGPFETTCTHFDAGTRAIEIVRLTAGAITYRLKGKPGEEYTITHAMAFMRAIGAAAGFDAGPRESKRITRGSC